MRAAAIAWVEAVKMPVTGDNDRVFQRADQKLQQAALKYAKACEQVRSEKTEQK